LPVIGQPVFEIGTSITVNGSGGSLKQPWSGGINAAQINTIRLNADTLEDLVIYDRACNKTNTYLAVNSPQGVQYQYAPWYEKSFGMLNQWVLFRDFDCDGLKDIYTHAPLGIAIYKNLASPPSLPLFVLVTDTVMVPSLSGTGRVNLQINATDVPEVFDYDADGDLDILTGYYGGSSMILFRNYSRDRTGACGIDYEYDDLCFGKFLLSATCGAYQTGQSCRFAAPDSGKPDSRPARVLHNGTGSVAAHLFSDSLYDLLMSDANCTQLYYLKNVGTRQNARYTGAALFPPGGGAGADLYIFPATSPHDFNHDGKQDFIVSPNVLTSDKGLSDFKTSMWFYKNNGTYNNPNYVLETKGFLQNDMIEVGEEASPAFADYDADGDLDMFIGDKGTNTGSLQRGGITLYKNTGSSTNPQFSFITDDYLGFRNFNNHSIRPIFADINADGAADLVIVSGYGNRRTNMWFIFNNARPNTAFQLDTATATQFNYPAEVYDYPAFTDVNNDGLPDMLVGKYDGRLQYYVNSGTANNPAFSLVSNAAGGIASNFYKQNLSISIADYDQDGSRDLITTDYSGVIRFYANFIANINGNPIPDTNLTTTTTGTPN
jgi:FG-GAP-like repeat